MIERSTQVDGRRWSLQKVCGTLIRVAGCKIIMLTKSDDRMDTDTSSDIQLVLFIICVDSLSILIGRVRPSGAVS